MTTDHTPPAGQAETAHALLWRHGLPEDVIDGALCLHAQELAAMQRREADDLHQTEPGVVKGLRIGADLIDPTVPDDTDQPHQPAATPADDRAECAASISGSCLAEGQSETACDTDAGECVHGGRPRKGRTISVYFPPEAPDDVIERAFNQIADVWVTCQGDEGGGWDAFMVSHRGDPLHIDSDPAAVLPDTSRAAVLRELEQRYRGHARNSVHPDFRAAYAAVANDLSRLADEAQPDTEAYPPQHRWRVETFDYLAEQWAPGTGWPARDLAVERYNAMNEKAPAWKDGTPVQRRLVRETTTFTVEAQP